jgi:hypothetical protein
MSTQAASIPLRLIKWRNERTVSHEVIDPVEDKLPKSVELEILYQLCCSPPPTELELSKEKFLLECD